MAGKPYTMREMKTIVDYLTEHSAYGEVKARKMWINFANSKVTNRTWQSLKETFLKRILPDIHNPYYKLTMEQILSFRQGYDIEKKEKNKLEVQIVSDDSNTNAENQTDLEKPSTSNNNDGEKATGEDIKCSKIPSRNRSSADTLVLDNFYETAEEIQMELESPKGNGSVKNHDSGSKTLRDFITYSEPLTPMLQEVLHDFASESEGSDNEPQMEIVEEVSPDTNNPDSNDQASKSPSESTITETPSADVAKNAKGLASEVVEEVLLSEIKDTCSQLPKNKSIILKNQTRKNRNESHLDTTENTNSINIEVIVTIPDEDQSKEKNVTANTTEVTEFFTAKDSTENTSTTSLAGMKSNTSIEHKASGNNEKSTQNCSNSTNDTVIPNNQEALENGTAQKNSQEELKGTQEVFESHVKSDKAAQKRTNSEDDKVNKKSKVENSVKPIDKDGECISSVIDNISENENIKDSEKTELNPSTAQETPDITDTHPNTEEPTTSNKEEVVEAVKSLSKDKIEDSATPNENPCLKSVSLFAEQFNTTKYTDSNSSDVEIKTTNEDTSGALGSNNDAKNLVIDIINKDVVILKSHSETESHHDETPERKKKTTDRVSKAHRDRALANLFGFSSGGVTSSRKRQLSCHRRLRPNRHSHSHNKVSGSSEWTSDTESDMYVSPPRGRKNKHARKFLKPQSARILSLEEEGGLFVMHGKKIYPIVKDGKIVKNYLTFLPESGSEEEEDSYWRQKYVQEKKRAEELKKLLDQAKEPKPRDTSSPILPTNSSRKLTSNRNQSTRSPQSSIHSNSKELSVVEHGDVGRKGQLSEEKIKIKFTKNNEEVHLEGHWPQIHPVLEQVVNIFHKEPDLRVNETKPKVALNSVEPSNEIISGSTTPIPVTADPEVREKVDKIESEIFKQIEELDKEEHSMENGDGTNVTQRKGRPKKDSSSSTPTQSPAKRPRESRQTDVKKDGETSSKTRLTESEKASSTRRSKRIRTSQTSTNETVTSADTATRRTRKSIKESKDVEVKKTEADVRYMLPPTKKTVQKSLVNDKKKEKPNKSSANANFIPSPITLSRCSMESTQGYQDSDISPIKLNQQRKKRKLSLVIQKGKYPFNRTSRRKSYPMLAQDESDLNISSYFIPVKKNNTEHSTLNSDVYKSESYQLLLPQRRPSSRRLEIIDETSPMSIEPNATQNRNFNTISKCDIDNNFKVNIDNSDTSAHAHEIGSSSLSLPQSPEISVVENISISKDLLSKIAIHPTLNETQANSATEQTVHNKYFISDVDVSIPLMEQECELHKNNNGTSRKNDRMISAISESLLNKICSVNIEDTPTLSDSLDRKLRDLLLESAKKMSKDQENIQNSEMAMEVDASNRDTEVKTRAKKRCSTPRKKKSTRKAKVPKIDPVVEEEHTESCSRGGRQSCPPLIQVVTCEDNAGNNKDTVKNNKVKLSDKAKGKKDVIKVKILRPREKSLSQEKEIQKCFKECSRMSVCTDSGINDTESMVLSRVLNDSIDLIHNHSETCLNANECMGDSVEFVEPSLKSIVSINSNSFPSEDSEKFRLNEKNNTNITPELFCSNAQDIDFCSEENTNAELLKTQRDTIYSNHFHSDYNSSLLTADLSDEVPTQKESQPLISPSKWYLFSEDESTLNIQCTQGQMTSNFSAHLKQLFPITCAVPDLSTITEMSDNSRKPTLEESSIPADNFFSVNV